LGHSDTRGILLASQEEPGMFDFFRRFPWVLEPVRYTDQNALIAELDGTVIAPAEAKAKALAAKPHLRSNENIG